MSGGAAPPSIGVVVVSWNIRHLLDACLGSVVGAPGVAEVVVVDNASADGTVAYLKAHYPEVRLIANAANQGFSRAVNSGLRALGILPPGDQPSGPDDLSAPDPGATPLPAVLLLNPDAVLMPGALPKLWQRLASDQRIGCVGPRLVYPDGRHQPSMRRFPGLATALWESTPLAWHWPGNPVARRYRMADADARRPQTVDWLTGAVMLLRGQALRELGGLDESFFLYSEELDLCRRLTLAGWTVYYEPEAVAIHHEAASSDQVSAQRHLWFQQSRIRYYAKHHGRASASLLCLAVRAMFALELLLEGAKLMLGHKPVLRRARIMAYGAVIRQLHGTGDSPAQPKAVG